MLRQTPNRRHRWLAPANSDLESSYESRPGYHPMEVHTQAGPTQVSLHNQAVEALVVGSTLVAAKVTRKLVPQHRVARIVLISIVPVVVLGFLTALATWELGSRAPIGFAPQPSPAPNLPDFPWPPPAPSAR